VSKNYVVTLCGYGIWL